MCDRCLHRVRNENRFWKGNLRNRSDNTDKKKDGLILMTVEKTVDKPLKNVKGNLKKTGCRLISFLSFTPRPLLLVPSKFRIQISLLNYVLLFKRTTFSPNFFFHFCLNQFYKLNWRMIGNDWWIESW